LEQALEFSIKAIYIPEADENSLAAANAVYAKILNKTNDSIQIAKAVKHADIAINLAGKPNDWKNAILEKGNALNKLKMYDKSKEIYNAALRDERTIGDFDYRSIFLNNLATVALEEKEYHKAIGLLNKSLQSLKEYYQKKFDYTYAAAHENLADNYTALQQFDTALLHYQKALINLTNNFRNEDILQNPNPNDTSLFIYSNPDMIRVLHLKAISAFKYYQQNNNLKYLNLANQTYQTVFDFHDKLQKEISTENSRLFQAKNIMPYLENALKVAFELQQNGQDIGEAAFRFMEKNKATVLLQAMNEVEALHFAKLPDSLIEQEKELKLSVTYYKRSLYDAEQYEDTIEVKRLNDLVFENKNIYDTLINHLEENYPDYHNLKYQQNTDSLANIQNQLNDKKAILEYFVGDSSIFILSIQKDNSKLYKLKKPKNWNAVIENLLSNLNAQEVFHQDEYRPELFKKFTENAAQLYQYLLEQPLKDLGNKITHLQIIPDGILNYIPYGLLLRNNDSVNEFDYRKLSYLLKEKNISYTYSAALLLENNTNGEIDYTYNYAGFAPNFNGKYDPLTFTKNGVKSLASLLSGKPYIDNEATKSNFKKAADISKVFQLATHGFFDHKEPLNSKLILTNDSLEAYELYNMKIPAELGVLSACETGIGKEAKGEGIMSLSRAFTYSGCNSLVMSLWSIEDGSTAEIVENFFQHLKKGKAKDEALRQAKIDYLQSPETATDLTHPIYWAGLVQSGNTNPIDFGNCYCCYLLILVIIVLLLAIAWFNLKRKNSTTTGKPNKRHGGILWRVTE